MKYFDLHCDTLFEAYRQLKELDKNDLNFSFEKAGIYEDQRQVFAVWSEHGISSSEAYERFIRITDLFGSCLRPGDILAIEDGSLLEGDHREKIAEIKKTGVRILALVWKDISFIGGAWNTNEGLTPSGHEVLDGLFSEGIIPDVAHASDKMIYEVCEKALELGKPIVDTHTGARMISGHGRCITDEMFGLIRSTGGIAGITLYPPHISGNDKCSIDKVIDHIEHFLSLGGEKCLCIGADLDGVDDMLPDGIKDVSDVRKIAERMSVRGHPGDLIEDIFFNNANNFFKKYIN